MARISTQEKALDVPRAAYSRPCSSNASGLHGRNSARIGKSARAFKGIICDDVSEFESYMPSHAVGSLCAMSGSGTGPELRIPGAAAQTRIVSKARIPLDSRQICAIFQRDICVDISEFESFSIGAGWCQALSDCSVDPGFDVARRVLASLRDRHSGPPMMGSEGCGGPISRYVLAVRLTAGIKTRNGLASSIVPAGTSLHRVGGIQFSPIAIVHN